MIVTALTFAIVVNTIVAFLAVAVATTTVIAGIILLFTGTHLSPPTSTHPYSPKPLDPNPSTPKNS